MMKSPKKSIATPALKEAPIPEKGSMNMSA
jgi:hypothetical protein